MSAQPQTFAESKLWTQVQTLPQKRLEDAVPQHWLAILIGGSRGGKSDGGIQICGKAVNRGYRWVANPDPQVMTISLSSGQAEQALGKKVRGFMDPHNLPPGKVTERFTRAKLPYYYGFNNGGEYRMKYSSMDWEDFQGIELDLVHWDERPEHRALWDEVQVRLRPGTPLKQICTYTPTHGMDWFYHDFIKDAASMGVMVIQNPVFWYGLQG